MLRNSHICLIFEVKEVFDTENSLNIPKLRNILMKIYIIQGWKQYRYAGIIISKIEV